MAPPGFVGANRGGSAGGFEPKAENMTLSRVRIGSLSVHGPSIACFAAALWVCGCDNDDPGKAANSSAGASGQVTTTHASAGVGGVTQNSLTRSGSAVGGAQNPTIGSSPQGGATNQGGTSPVGVGGTTGVGTTVTNPLTNPSDGVPAGNPDGNSSVPAEAGLDDVSSPTKVVGDGTPVSCSGAAVVAAVWNDGNPVNRVTFNCGTAPITIPLTESIRIPNAPDGASTVIDGGGKVTLSGEGKVRLIYANACNSELGWYTSHCQDQDSPHLTVQNLTFIKGNAANIVKSDVDEPGGGAIWMRGGRLKVVNCRFFNNVCVSTGPDVGGGAIRVFDQFEDRPVYVVNSTFGGKQGLGNSCSNGGALSSIGVSWTVINSLFSYNEALGNGGNPAQGGTPGGGSGGAIYNDGNEMTLSISGTLIEQNTVKAYGGAIFFVTNNHTGTISITNSTIRSNPGGSWYPTYPGISNHDDTPITVVNSSIAQ